MDPLPRPTISEALDPDAPLDEADRGRLRWRCRRGLLENDLFVERYFRAHEAPLTWREARALARLMELPDNDLLDLLLARREPEGELVDPDVRRVLDALRSAPV
ncbi:succinate dehydrogenase assembly factor 2 [Piscinibacter sp. Jin2]|uniref:FAD assembly factor SdhE n=1 Tax=Aquariibacter lacus TaxID=2801332 RepID=A0A9X0XC94_9BURK|nr:succinate dehydrogenase assembly factor 2 [Piscinibacter lacus]MBL0719607.1 succinate dehydrogenase assembly factor 2 [Piscinibacter lacus]